MSDFQAAAGRQGRLFTEQCRFLLEHNGFTLRGPRLIRELGIEIDEVAISSRSGEVWFEYKGSFQGLRPGLLRTDTVKKAIANGALLASLGEHPPYVVLTSHVPASGSAQAMVRVALELGYFADVIPINEPAAAARLQTY
jgi:hypothetical protein